MSQNIASEFQTLLTISPVCWQRRVKSSEKVPQASVDFARCELSTGLLMERKHVGGAFIERKSWWSWWSIYSEWKSQRPISEHALLPERSRIDQGLQAWSYVPEECLKYSAFHHSGCGALINFYGVFLDFQKYFRNTFLLPDWNSRVLWDMGSNSHHTSVCT